MGPGHGGGTLILLPRSQPGQWFPLGLSYPLAGDTCWSCKSARAQGLLLKSLCFESRAETQGTRKWMGSPLQTQPQMWLLCLTSVSSGVWFPPLDSVAFAPGIHEEAESCAVSYPEPCL